jgi:hypothetical protein
MMGEFHLTGFEGSEEGTCCNEGLTLICPLKVEDRGNSLS